ERFRPSQDKAERPYPAFLEVRLGPAVKDGIEPMLRQLSAMSLAGSDAEWVVRALVAMGAPPERVAEAMRKNFSRPELTTPLGSYSLSLISYDLEGAWSVPIAAAPLESPDSA